jgi:hypothetical protein
MALSSQIIQALFTRDYHYAPSFLFLYMITFIYTGIGSLINIPLLNSQKYTNETLKIQFIQFIITILPSFYIIPLYGGNGALVLLLFGVGLSKIYAVIRIKHIFGFTPNFKSSIKLFFSGAISCFITWYIFSELSLNQWTEILLGSIVSLIIYFILVIKMRVLDEKDYRRFKEIGSILGPFSSYFSRLVDVISEL